VDTVQIYAPLVLVVGAIYLTPARYTYESRSF